MGTSCTRSVWEVPSQTLWIHPSFAFSFDHPVGAGEQRRRDFEAERTAPRHQACCLLAKAPPLSHASPLARPPPSCRSRLRRSPFPPSAATRTGHAKLGRIWSTRLLTSSLRPHPGRMGRQPSSFRDIPTARRLARRNSALAPPAPRPVDRRQTVQQG